MSACHRFRLFMSLIVLILTMNGVANCPLDWQPIPCKCLNGPESSTSVFCNDAKTGEEIKSAFAQLNNTYEFTNFIMDGSGVESLPSNVFGKASFKRILIYDNNDLKCLDDDTFLGSELSVTDLRLRGNNFGKFNFNTLKIFENLRYFELLRDKREKVAHDKDLQREFISNKP